MLIKENQKERNAQIAKQKKLSFDKALWELGVAQKFITLKKNIQRT
jgi:hypothetical protein